MAQKATSAKKKEDPPRDPDGMFSGMVVFLVVSGVQARRLQIWKKKLEQKGAVIEESLSKRVTHIFAMNWGALQKQVGDRRLAHFKGEVLLYQWLEDSLSSGEKVSGDQYILRKDPGGVKISHESSQEHSEHANENYSSSNEIPDYKKIRSSSPEDSKDSSAESRDTARNYAVNEASASPKGNDKLCHALCTSNASLNTAGSPDKSTGVVQPYNPPDMNRNVTEIFKKLIDIYRALGDERRSFSYYKAIPVIEKLNFKIESAEQVKHLPAIGKSLQDHIQEIVTTGKLSKLEHFEKDEKVCTISLFGEVWGIGPTTALKLYDKGHRTLEDLQKEESLTNAQKVGLKYYNDIKMRIPRHEVEEMEGLLKKVGEEVLPGVVVVCGGSYRRGKVSCGDMDIIITHPDGRSHGGFLPKYVKRLKEMNFLREDLVFSVHSEKGSDSGVDTYFGLCTYPGQELRHRIDLKVYPRDIYAFGLLAWTGNDTLNRRLRLLAESKGYQLDDTGLFPATPASGSKRGVRATSSLHLSTEREVFDFLGFLWLEPHERNL
ncbi:hypothetical protein Nepgr_022542 [Nepenthes gracilis]|uniref:DNA polymerase n=1 Tax=Nepenthes gracilis TaxID=150966 RepID=A0AAD3XYI7_NEPGR|nr:hypothetical protein Nepgr_022542 [Nepenthes gracilis]